MEQVFFPPVISQFSGRDFKKIVSSSSVQEQAKSKGSGGRRDT